MRILHLIPSFFHGGAERQLSYLAPELAKLGHEVHIAYAMEGPNIVSLDSSKIFLHKLNYKSNYGPTIILKLGKLIDKINPDLVQTWITQMDILGGIAALLRWKPWIMREPNSESFYVNSWKNMLRRFLGGRAAAIVANSQGGKNYWNSYYEDKKVYVIPNGLPLTAIYQAKACSGFDGDKKIVLYVGRFDEQKNINNLLKALASVVREPEIMAVLCGDGPQRPMAERLVQEWNLANRVRIPGFVDNVWPWMKRADVFVSVSHVEGNPNAVLEAMACGCPLVVSDIPAHREFLDGESALIVDRLDPVEIAGAIRRCLEDPDAARSRAEIAKAKTAGLAVSVVARRYEQVYLDVLKSSRRLKGLER